MLPACIYTASRSNGPLMQNDIIFLRGYSFFLLNLFRTLTNSFTGHQQPALQHLAQLPSYFGSIRWCVWSFRPSSSFQLPHLKCLLLLFQCYCSCAAGSAGSCCTWSVRNLLRAAATSKIRGRARLPRWRCGASVSSPCHTNE